jgi:hypothetical protein
MDKDKTEQFCLIAISILADQGEMKARLLFTAIQERWREGQLGEELPFLYYSAGIEALCADGKISRREDKEGPIRETQYIITRTGQKKPMRRATKRPSSRTVPNRAARSALA